MMFCAVTVCNIPRTCIETEDCIYNKRQSVGKNIKNEVFLKTDFKNTHFCTTTMPIYILCNSAMKSLFRKHQRHILLVLDKKHIPSKHLEIYEDYPKELSENCLRFSPMVDKTSDINSRYILNAAGVSFSGCFGCLRQKQDRRSQTMPLY